MITDLSQCTDKNTSKFSFKGEKRLAKCTSVYDGDTAYFAFQMFANAPFYRFSCRMYGYNSAEIKGGSADEKASAQAARARLQGLIEGQICTLQFYDFDKYGRPLADVYIETANGTLHVNKLMVDEGHGVPYFGKGEKKWQYLFRP